MNLEKVDIKREINDLEGITDLVIAELGNVEYFIYDDQDKRYLCINSELITK